MSATSRAGRATPAAASGGRRHGALLERAPDFADGPGGDLAIERRGAELLVPEQHLDDTDVDLLLAPVGAEDGPEGLEGDAPVDPGPLCCGVAGAVELGRGQRLYPIAAREQPAI